MLKINCPNITHAQSINSCQQGITGNFQLQGKLENSKTSLAANSSQYINLARTEDLYTITAFTQENEVPIVAELEKADLIKLYDNYFAKNGKPGRKIYDTLMVAAKDKCPFCGGIGRPTNLDHFLPKTFYPQFSILPANLIPACRDCNMGTKRNKIASSKEEQAIHPYLDHERYFNEQWIFARYIKPHNDEPATIEYFPKPNKHWQDYQKKRVINYFNNFDLAKRYSIEANARLGIYLEQINYLENINLLEKSSNGREELKKTILTPTIKKITFVNHWERVMCEALMNCSI